VFGSAIRHAPHGSWRSPALIVAHESGKGVSAQAARSVRQAPGRSRGPAPSIGSRKRRWCRKRHSCPCPHRTTSADAIGLRLVEASRPTISSLKRPGDPDRSFSHATQLSYRTIRVVSRRSLYRNGDGHHPLRARAQSSVRFPQRRWPLGGDERLVRAAPKAISPRARGSCSESALGCEALSNAACATVAPELMRFPGVGRVPGSKKVHRWTLRWRMKLPAACD